MYNFTNPDTIQSLLKKHNFAPNKFLGQNFLVDEEVLGKIIEAADLRVGDNVLEIGPGLGILTQALLAKGANVVAIEKDKELIPVLEENLREIRFSGADDKLKIINDDFLAVDLEKVISNFPLGSRASKWDLEARLPSGKFAGLKKSKLKVISNIPYYITSPVLRKILTAETKPEEIVFLVQREVAERISAKAGDMSVISVFVQFYGTPSVVQIVKPESFWPAPKVESAILKIVIKNDGKGLLKQLAPLRQGFGGFLSLSERQAASDREEKEFWRLVKIGFSSRRKTLANNLAAGFSAFGGSAEGGPTSREKIKKTLETLGFTDKTRAQELSVEDWVKLFRENC